MQEYTPAPSNGRLHQSRISNSGVPLTTDQEGLVQPPHADASGDGTSVVVSAAAKTQRQRLALFDAAPFFGHYEFDLFCMSRTFIDEYNRVRPAAPGQAARLRLYELWKNLHLLQHRHLDQSRYRQRVLADLELLLGIATTRGASLESIVLPAPAPSSKSKPRASIGGGGDTPITKFIRAPADPHDGGSNVVLIQCGTFCPIHYNHITIMDAAKRCMEEQHSTVVIGGLFVPATDQWASKKLQGQGVETGGKKAEVGKGPERARGERPQPTGFIPLHHRQAMIALACENTGWDVDRSGYHSYKDIGPHVERVLQDKLGICGRAVFVCGMDSIAKTEQLVPGSYTIVCVRRNDCERYIEEYAGKIGMDKWATKTASCVMYRSAVLQTQTEQIRLHLPM
jgi:nicotinic acid mononucleotide adenylyltransferase